jgi:hypothetical protein
MMVASRSFLVALLFLVPSYALADEPPDPPPNFGNCTAISQKTSPTDECKECNNIYKEGCEKKFKGTDFARKCQIKPKHANEWREVWCKAPAKKEEPVSKAVEPASTSAPSKEMSKTPDVKGPDIKAPELTKETTPRVATEATKEAGCTVAPTGSASWMLLAVLALLRRKNKKENS